MRSSTRCLHRLTGADQGMQWPQLNKRGVRLRQFLANTHHGSEDSELCDSQVVPFDGVHRRVERIAPKSGTKVAKGLLVPSLSKGHFAEPCHSHLRTFFPSAEINTNCDFHYGHAVSPLQVTRHHNRPQVRNGLGLQDWDHFL